MEFIPDHIVPIVTAFLKDKPFKAGVPELCVTARVVRLHHPTTDAAVSSITIPYAWIGQDIDIIQPLIEGILKEACHAGVNDPAARG